MVIWKKHLHRQVSAKNDTTGVTNFRPHGWSHVVMSRLWYSLIYGKQVFALLTTLVKAWQKKTCQPFSWSKVPISINGVDKSRSPEPSKTSWGQPTLEGYSHYPKFDRGSPFFSSIEYIFASLFVHFLLLLVCSIFFLVERQTIQQGWRSTQQISGLWKPSAVQRLHPAKPTECFTSSKKPCPFAVKNNRDHM